MISGKIRFALRLTFCNAKITIPEMEQGNKYSLEGKYSLALGSYSRVIEIMNSAKLNEQQSADYVQAVIKLAASEFINAKYQQSSKTVRLITTNLDQPIANYLQFLHFCNQHYIAFTQQPYNIVNANQGIKQIVDKLLSSAAKDNINNQKLPILSNLCNNLNNAVDYQKLLVSLVQRSPKSAKAQSPIQQIKQICQNDINPELQLVSLMGIILQNKVLSAVDKQKINGVANEILKKYEQGRPKQVYKPLLVIVMSLIGQKHYMSAEGMIGYLKTQQQTLISNYANNDKNLINNIYRMLVTRANNQKFEVGWAKEESVKLGSLVAERIIKAPLLGHSLNHIIC